MLVSSLRKLIAIATLFTIGHSITLTLTSLELVSVNSGLVEILIALSLVFLMAEVLQKNKTQTSFGRKPWLFGLLFGLVHGFGFAGVLQEIGLPSGQIPLALFSFNIGIEFAQLSFIITTLLIWQLFKRFELQRINIPTAIQKVPIYCLGITAGFWFFERILA